MSTETNTLSQALADSLRNMRPRVRDRALVELAKHYATLIDATAAGDPATARKVAVDLGPKYLAVLAALGLTRVAAARAAESAKGGASDVVSSDGTGSAEVDELRARRAKRLSG